MGGAAIGDLAAHAEDAVAVDGGAAGGGAGVAEQRWNHRIQCG